MTAKQIIIFLLILLILPGCIAKFIPAVNENKEVLVVQGLITDQPETDTIKLSKSIPFGRLSDASPVTGSIVTISDDQGNRYSCLLYTSPCPRDGLLYRMPS